MARVRTRRDGPGVRQPRGSSRRRSRASTPRPAPLRRLLRLHPDPQRAGRSPDLRREAREMERSSPGIRGSPKRRRPSLSCWLAASRRAARAAPTTSWSRASSTSRVARAEGRASSTRCLPCRRVDASIVTIEDNEIRRIANELKIEHGEYIAVRARHLENLQVLKPHDSEMIAVVCQRLPAAGLARPL